METFTLLCFGVARDITGSSTVTLHISTSSTHRLRPRPNVSELRAQLIADFPAFGELVSFAIARNEEYAREEDVVSAGDTLAIIPPVSGG